jgi:hypothetical protein
MPQKGSAVIEAANRGCSKIWINAGHGSIAVVAQPRIFTLNIKQPLPSIDLELRDDRNATEHIPMISDLVPEDVFQHPPILEPLVDCFLSVPDALLHSITVNVIGNALWALDKAWSLSKATIVSFHSFIFTEVAHDGVAKHHEVIPRATLMRPIDPNAITSDDTQPHFTSKTRFLELVAAKPATMLRNATVRAINRQQAIIAFVSFQPVLKCDLLAKNK